MLCCCCMQKKWTYLYFINLSKVYARKMFWLYRCTLSVKTSAIWNIQINIVNSRVVLTFLNSSKEMASSLSASASWMARSAMHCSCSSVTCRPSIDRNTCESQSSTESRRFQVQNSQADILLFLHLQNELMVNLRARVSSRLTSTRWYMIKSFSSLVV